MPGPTPSQPGWYPDGDGNERWYDGNGWTDHVRGAAAAPADGPASHEPTVVVPTGGPPTSELPQAGSPPPGATSGLEVGGGRGLRIAIAVLGALVLIAVVAVGAVALLGGDDSDRSTDDATSESDTATPGEDESSLDLPTIDPSDFPSDVPTGIPTDDLPTEVPPEVPGVPELPSGFPSDLPSEFPTDPADLESWFSDYLEQMNP